MKKNIIPLLLTFLSACASQPTPLLPSAVYGEWEANPNSCNIRARAADFVVMTDGRVVGQSMAVDMIFNRPLPQKPKVDLGDPSAPLELDGSGYKYTLTLPYTPDTAAQMLDEQTYLNVRYVTDAAPYVLESSFQARGLMHALADLGHQCP